MLNCAGNSGFQREGDLLLGLTEEVDPEIQGGPGPRRLRAESIQFLAARFQSTLDIGNPLVRSLRGGFLFQPSSLPDPGLLDAGLEEFVSTILEEGRRRVAAHPEETPEHHPRTEQARTETDDVSGGKPGHDLGC